MPAAAVPHLPLSHHYISPEEPELHLFKANDPSDLRKGGGGGGNFARCSWPGAVNRISCIEGRYLTDAIATDGIAGPDHERC